MDAKVGKVVKGTNGSMLVQVVPGEYFRLKIRAKPGDIVWERGGVQWVELDALGRLHRKTWTS